MAQSQEDVKTSLPQKDPMSTRIPDRRHSTDGSCGAPCPGAGSLAAGNGSRDGSRFHPYRRQFSEGSVPASGELQRCSPYYGCFRDPESPGAYSATRGSGSEPQLFWEQYNSSSLQDDRFMGTQSTYAALPATPVEPPYYLCQSQGSFRTPGPQDAPSNSLFPKPVYSYSILIFMALKNSKTGSLPVSEIYNFMTEHFPYFKTAPDGWKNSVRHNLSLNKCFEKVENKNGNSSRKGCLWALNPAKVEKMHEELHKWRRKDPVSVRKKDLDRLMGEKPEKVSPLSAYHRQPSLSKRSPVYDKTTMSLHTCALRDPCVPAPRPHYHPITSPPQRRAYPSHANGPHASVAPRFPLYSPCPLSPPFSALGGPSSSAAAGKIPPPYHTSVHPDYAIVSRSGQDVHVEGDASYDVDTLNPSLMDLQLHGNLWEELRDDSMVPDPLANITTAFTLPLDHLQSHGLQALAAVNRTSQDVAIGLGKEGTVLDGSAGGGVFSEQNSTNGLYPMMYSGVENLAVCFTPCPTLISLL
ncbi:hypothetical protein NHX12_008059 [Muraenolepis orangiensis]|uniref:Fork-head domain-containing protein n=1 Tax=Muraenolepis orangiensis TaxID=630683 RepID=A0A9Q0DN53_9TELE|nr:hypothetical protein NHX12_008059 [Muraenolepis orangiensis]